VGGSSFDGLIAALHIGGSGSDNPYRNINEILKRLGIKSSAVEPHKHHFHIYLRPPTVVEIATTRHLLAGAPSTSPTELTTTTMQTDAQGLLDYTRTLTEAGEEIMFTMDVPYVPAQDTAIVLAQAATPAATATPADYLLKTCMEGGGRWNELDWSYSSACRRIGKSK